MLWPFFKVSSSCAQHGLLPLFCLAPMISTGDRAIRTLDAEAEVKDNYKGVETELYEEFFK